MATISEKDQNMLTFVLVFILGFMVCKTFPGIMSNMCNSSGMERFNVGAQCGGSKIDGEGFTVSAQKAEGFAIAAANAAAMAEGFAVSAQNNANAAANSANDSESTLDEIKDFFKKIIKQLKLLLGFGPSCTGTATDTSVDCEDAFLEAANNTATSCPAGCTYDSGSNAPTGPSCTGTADPITCEFTEGGTDEIHCPTGCTYTRDSSANENHTCAGGPITPTCAFTGNDTNEASCPAGCIYTAGPPPPPANTR